MFRVNKLTDYSVELLSVMARVPEQRLSASDLVKMTALNKPTVSKILKLLSKGNIIASQRGIEGGYVLARRSEKISIAAIITVMEGQVALTECSAVSGICEHERACSVRTNWQKINIAVLKALEAVKLSDLVSDTLNPCLPLLSKARS